MEDNAHFPGNPGGDLKKGRRMAYNTERLRKTRSALRGEEDGHANEYRH
ncbi:MAG: hypothetical protein SPG32_13970 [Candidatus Ventricola sp.]|nr:hypothetical protein [Candidatus Ventricola sp.]